MEYVSTLRVFSVIINVKSFVNSKKDKDLFRLIGMNVYKKSPKYYEIHSKRIYNEVANSYYTLKDLVTYLLYLYMIGESPVKLNRVNHKNIKEFKRWLTDKRYKEDLEIIKEVYQAANFKKINDFFTINEEGTNVIFELTKKKHISPRFFIKNLEKGLTNIREDSTISKEYETFVKIARKIKNL